ncbi:MAG: hypothetical protein JWO20_1220 [Candidatus Angelobacter sp.]|jgi:hypothetical protein|nr:hypothetical protein [Candidatus Angelobacter sp.]
MSKNRDSFPKRECVTVIDAFTIFDLESVSTEWDDG